MHAGDLQKASSEFNVLKRDTYNALIDSLKDKSLTQPGYSFADRQVAVRPKSYNRQYFYFTCELPLLERCIFGIILNPEQETNDPPIVAALNINSSTNASPFGLFTNIQAYNPTDGFGLCKAIDYYEATLLFVSDEENIPLVGMPCGPDNNTNGWGISGWNAYGLICISEIDENNNVWCIRTDQPTGIIGVVVDNDIEPYNQENSTLGEGYVTVFYNGLNELVAAQGPDDNLLQLPVWNSSSNTFKVGEQVKCVAVTGVGLVIVDNKSLVIGRAVQNIAHYTAGTVNIYTGLPGEETWDGLTTATAFNQLNEIVANEFVFMLPVLFSQPEEAEITEEIPVEEEVGAEGETTTVVEDEEIEKDVVIQYYIISSEYSGKVIGQTTEDVTGGSDSQVNVTLWAGAPGAEINIGEEVDANVGFIFGAIPANTWVVCNHVAGDVNENGYYQVIAAQRGNSFVAQVLEGSANSKLGYVDVDETCKVTLYIGVEPEITELVVYAFVKYAPVFDNELVQVEWNGNIFIITRGELDGGFYAVAQQGKITNGSTGTVAMKQIANSSVLVSSIKVDTQEGDVEQGRTVYCFRNRGGIHIASKSCS